MLLFAIYQGATMPNPDARPDPSKPTRSTSPKENPLAALEVVVLRQPKLNLGQVVMTANALDVLTLDDVNIPSPSDNSPR